MGVSIAMVTIVALAGSGIYFGLRTLENYNPGRKKIQKDLKELKAQLLPFINDLVPWSEEEQEQLSLNMVKKKSSKNIVTTVKGLFSTVYHEPLIAWAYRKYVSSKENALLYAKTSHHEFIYRIKKNWTEVVVDSQPLGHINDEGVLFQQKGKKALAQITSSSESLGLPIVIGQKEVAQLTNPNKMDGSRIRAFQTVSQMGAEEEKIFLALSILEMVKRQI
ncbi:MAG TPA: hypothetical protein ENJ95_15370 [Bacteroidetes bacterium]|nr:hypothetical protein [Bacteroidota bacterium]